jgi:SNF2 family DNA or RNA helicase
MIPPLYEHQEEDIKFYLKNKIVFNTADPGTGKTRVVLESLARTPITKRGRTLILCPKSLMQCAWGNDIEKFTPSLTYQIAPAGNRASPFYSDSDIVITNHDATKALVENLPHTLYNKFNTLIIDESTAYKNHTAARSKYAIKLAHRMSNRSCLSGTPTPNSILDLWNQLLILDEGEHLGKSYYRFRALTCDPRPIPGVFGATNWIDKPGIELVIAELIKDITIRRKLEDCISIPDQNIYSIIYTPSDTLLNTYKRLKKDALLELQDRNITALNAAAVINKLLQLLSGAVYDNENYTIFDNNRYKLVLDLVEARQHSLVAFNWKHQRDGLCKEANARNIIHAVIDGETPLDTRTQIIEDFQKGKYQVLFAHPQSAGHGITLTKATTTIWCSPIYNSNLEQFLQFNRRSYRAGQTEKTEVILITTQMLEPGIYERLQGKNEKLTNLLELLK